MGCTTCGGGNGNNSSGRKNWRFTKPAPQQTVIDSVSSLRAATSDNLEVIQSFAKGEDKEKANIAIDALVELEAKDQLKEVIKELKPNESFKGTGKRTMETWGVVAKNIINGSND